MGKAKPPKTKARRGPRTFKRPAYLVRPEDGGPPAPPKPPVPPVLPAEREEEEFDPTWSRYTTKMKLRREEFCREYVKDFNASQTMLRLGSKSKQPWVHGSEMVRDPYVQWYLRQLCEKMDEKVIVTNNEILLGLKREANSTEIDASAASRVSALRSLAKIKGMEIDRSESKVTLGGGVMLIPAPASPEEWEKATAKAQAELKQAVRV